MSTEHRTIEPPKAQQTAEPAAVQQYEIRVGGHLGTRWAAWFDGMTLDTEADGATVISGPVVDQAAMYGLLEKLRDLGLSLLSVSPVSPVSPVPADPADTGDAADTGIQQPGPTTDHTRHHQAGATS